MCDLACLEAIEVLVLFQRRVPEDVAAHGILIDVEAAVGHLELVLLEDPLQARQLACTLKRSDLRVGSVPCLTPRSAVRSPEPHLGLQGVANPLEQLLVRHEANVPAVPVVDREDDSLAGLPGGQAQTSSA